MLYQPGLIASSVLNLSIGPYNQVITLVIFALLISDSSSLILFCFMYSLTRPHFVSMYWCFMNVHIPSLSFSVLEFHYAMQQILSYFIVIADNCSIFDIQQTM